MRNTNVVIGATFTAQPLDKCLKELGVHQLRFLPYNQLLQNLLQPAGIDNHSTLVLLIRFSDLIRYEKGEGKELTAMLRERAQTYLQAITKFCQGRSGAVLTLIVPSPSLSASGIDLQHACRDIEQEFAALPTLHADWKSFESEAALSRYFDPIADKLGHIPFTIDCFQGLSKFLSKHIPDVNSPGELAQRAAVPDEQQGQDALLRRFLQRLKLQASCRDIATEEQFAAAAKLSHTAATYHLTARRYTADALKRVLAEPGMRGLTIEVEDRLGQYGVSGFVLMKTGAMPAITEFVLSCVVLGKQLEHCLMRAFADVAEAFGAEMLTIEYLDLKANREAVRFLDSLCRAANGRQGDGDTNVMRKILPIVGLRDAALAIAVSPEMILEAEIDLQRVR